MQPNPENIDVLNLQNIHYEIAEFQQMQPYNILHDVFKGWKKNVDFSVGQLAEHVMAAPKVECNSKKLSPFIHLGAHTVAGQINKIIPGSYNNNGKYEKNAFLKQAILESFIIASSGCPSFSIYTGPFNLPRGMKMIADIWRLSVPGIFNGKNVIICATYIEHDKFFVS